MMAKTDDQLMKKIAKGDHDAFRELFERHCDYVYGYAVRLMAGDRLKAEDISQTVWMKVIESSKDFLSHQAFPAWIGAITRNTAFNHFRNLSRHPEAAIDEGEEEGWEDQSESIESQLMQRFEQEKVRSAIDDLPDTQRAVLVMWMAEDVSYEELAKAFDMTVSSVKSLLFRAKRNLEAKLKKEDL
jgi:RNA polymerase sigma-70 factor (ECF subfamily)